MFPFPDPRQYPNPLANALRGNPLAPAAAVPAGQPPGLPPGLVPGQPPVNPMDVVGGDDQTARGAADVLGQQIQRQRRGAALAAIAAGQPQQLPGLLSNQANQQQAQLWSGLQQRPQYERQVRENRQAAQEEADWERPETLTALRATIKGYRPEGLTDQQIDQMPSRVLRELLPMGERAWRERYQRETAKQVAGIRASAGPLGTNPEDAKAIAQAIADGRQPPVLTGLYRAGFPVRAELGRMGYNLAKAQMDWTGATQYMRTINNSQQIRLREAVEMVPGQIELVESLFDDWWKLGYGNRFKGWNRAALAAAKQAGGEPAAAAATVESQINLLIGELATVIMGGYAPTDHAFGLARAALAADWDERTFKTLLKNLRADVLVRRNSIRNVGVVGAQGLGGGNPYLPDIGGGGVETQQPPGPPPGGGGGAAAAPPSGGGPPGTSPDPLAAIRQKYGLK